MIKVNQASRKKIVEKPDKHIVSEPNKIYQRMNHEVGEFVQLEM